MELVAEHNGSIGLTNLSRSLGLDKTTVKRLTDTLIACGYLRRDPHDKTYFVTLKVVSLGYSAICGLEWRSVVEDHLRELFAEIGETVSLATLQGTDVLYLARCAKIEYLPMDIRVGARLPAHATAMGKILLAALGAGAIPILDRMEIRPLTMYGVRNRAELDVQLAIAKQRGFAVSDREISILARVVAAPLFYRGYPLAAISIAVQSQDYSLRDLEDVLAPKLMACADRVSSSMDRLSL
jgi:IclR family pca regulon transcriptional regulator